MEDFLREWGYLGIFLGIIATGAGFPMPEELPVVVGGVLVGAHADVRWWIMLPTCIVAVIIGDSLLYFIGRLWGPRVVEWPLIKKHVLPPERLQKIEENFHKYGITILLFARLTPGIRAPIFLTAGIVRLSLVRFILADAIYAVPGVSLLFYLGYVFTEQMVAFIHETEQLKSVFILVLVLAVAGYFLYRFLRRPVVTGDPAEMPKIAEEVAHALESATSKILPPHGKNEPATEPVLSAPHSPASGERGGGEGASHAAPTPPLSGNTPAAQQPHLPATDAQTRASP